MCVCVLGFFRSKVLMDLHLYRKEVFILGGDQFVLAMSYAARAIFVLFGSS